MADENFAAVRANANAIRGIADGNGGHHGIGAQINHGNIIGRVVRDVGKSPGCLRRHGDRGRLRRCHIGGGKADISRSADRQSDQGIVVGPDKGWIAGAGKSDGSGIAHAISLVARVVHAGTGAYGDLKNCRCPGAGAGFGGHRDLGGLGRGQVCCRKTDVPGS